MWVHVYVHYICVSRIHVLRCGVHKTEDEERERKSEKGDVVCEDEKNFLGHLKTKKGQ